MAGKRRPPATHGAEATGRTRPVASEAGCVSRSVNHMAIFQERDLKLTTVEPLIHHAMHISRKSVKVLQSARCALMWRREGDICREKLARTCRLGGDWRLLLVLAFFATEGFATPSRIVGRVLDAVSLNGLQSAEVRLLRGDEVLAEAESGDRGEFELTAPGPGVYRLCAFLGGYVEPFLSAGALRIGGDSDSRATLYLARGAALAGSVVSASGGAVRGAKVTALLRRGTEQAPVFVYSGAVAFTDDRGQYRLFGLRPGVYSAVVTSDGAQIGAAIFAPVYYGGGVEPRQARFVRLAAGETRERVDFILPPGEGGSLSGTLSHAPPEWLEGKAVVAVFHASNPESPLAVTRIDPTGEFRFPSLPPGNYRVVVMGPVIGWGGSGPVFSSPLRRAARSVEVRTGETANIEIDSPAAFNVQGIIRLSGGDRDAVCSERLQVHLQLLDATLDAKPLAAVVSRDEFCLTGVPLGRYRIEISGAPPPCSLREVREGDALLPDQIIDLRADSALSLMLSRASASVRGIAARPEAGESSPRFVLMLPADPGLTPESGSLSAEIDSEGSFRFDNVTPGTYQLMAIRQLDCTPFDPEFRASIPSVTVEVREGENVISRLEVRP